MSYFSKRSGSLKQGSTSPLEAVSPGEYGSSGLWTLTLTPPASIIANTTEHLTNSDDQDE